VLRDAKVEYLSWARHAQRTPRRISLLLSGLDTPLDRIPFHIADLELAVPPAYEDATLLEGLSRRYGVSVSEVFPALGTSQGIFLALAAILKPGDEVLTERPGYEPLREVPKALGASVRFFTRNPEEGYALDPERVLREWRPGTSVVVIADSHNPTGAMAGDEALNRLARELESRGTILLIDEVYRDFRPGALGTGRQLGGNVVITSSFTKVYGLGDLRAGWILGPPRVVARLQEMMDVFESIGPVPAQAFFRRSFEIIDTLRDEALAKAAAGWSVVESWAREEPRVRVTHPAGGIIAWVRLPEGRTGSDIARRLEVEHDVAVVPGRFFDDDSGIRIGYGGDPALTRQGLEALSRVL
jgi:aspartate/methionine/tyrosine aminotransferase